MKKTRWLSLLLVMMLAAMFVVGCPEDDNDDDNNNNPAGPTGDVTADEMSDQELETVTQQVMVAGTEGAVTTAMGMKATFNNGMFMAPNATEPGNLAMKPLHSIAEPEPGWTGPDNDGWYTYTEDDQFFDEMKIRLTPDVWSAEHEGEDLTKVEYFLSSQMEQQGVVTTIQWNYWAQVNNARTLMEGAYDYTFNYEYNVRGQDLSYEYAWEFSFENVALEEGNYAGEYHSSQTWPLMGRAGYDMVAMTTDNTFDSEAMGDGMGAIAGEEYIRFTYEGVSNSYIQGYYTVKRENWETHHPIEIYAGG